MINSLAIYTNTIKKQQ